MNTLWLISILMGAGGAITSAFFIGQAVAYRRMERFVKENGEPAATNPGASRVSGAGE